MTLDALKSGRIMGASQDGSREFLSLLACICADGTKLPPALIYKGESHDMLDSWIQDFKEGQQAYFASTANGWSCDDLGLQWLQKVFHKHTKAKARNRRRLLIVDGHSSHVNLKFIDWADRHRIILMILPPHSTHRLQPLDVSLFSPLATAYSNQLTKLMFDSFGLVSMSKREFWPLFRVSWEEAFTQENILSGFANTGIWPYKPSIVLDKIKHPAAPKPSIIEERTPMTCRAVRRVHKAYQKSPCAKRLTYILNANSRLAAANSIAQHTISGLIRALKTEKKKRSRGRRLNLVREDDNGPQFYSPTRVLRAKEFASKKDVEEQENRDRIDQNKATALAKRLQKEKDVAARALQASIRKQEVARLKLQKAAEVQARKDQREAAKHAHKAQKAQKRTQTSNPKCQSPAIVRRQSLVVANVGGVFAETNVVTSRGRRVVRPAKLST